MTPTERAVGRFMRAPDGHDAGGGGGEGAAAEAGAGGGGAGDGGEQGAGDAGDGADDATVLGGAGEGGAEGGEGQEGAKDKGEAGEAGDEGGPAGAPEKYELTPPEGFEALDADMLTAAEPVLRDLNLSNEQAQKLVPLMGQAVQRATEQAQQALTDGAAAQRKEWAEQFEADPEIGGANRKATEAAAARAFDHYGIKPGEGVRKLLDESGLGNHPDLIRFVARVGADLAEGSFERGSEVRAEKPAEAKLYGEEFQPKK
ncbi:peptidase [Sphingomonas koreensis]|uniref:Peptidase n=1 Tax=Sphingomonas koreensis TaxID=93064 RepID=A0A430G2C4_9SPHN|nr:peptidase [Sphingomonas koreensis]RSY83122.1 peptidase [Sphingomonas koreensis]